jgi:hypothetical protein
MQWECATSALATLLHWRDTVLALTLGQIWTAIYNPPDKSWKVAVLVIAILYKTPQWWAKWCNWRLSRKVVRFNWPVPPVSRVACFLG